MSFTSPNRSSTASATSSGIPRRRSASASCARVRGAAVSIRRQICRAAASGSPAWLPGSPIRPARFPAWPAGAACSPLRRTTGSGGLARGNPGDYRKVRLRACACACACASACVSACVSIEPRADAHLLLELLLDLVGKVRVVAQEIPGVLLALAELIAFVGVPGTGLADDCMLHAKVDQAALPADADAVQDVELGDLERRAALILDDFYAGAVTDGIGAVFERLDAPDVQPYGRVELQRLTAGGRLG